MATKYRAYWADRLFVGRAYMNDAGTLLEARKAISARIKDERWRGSRFAALWADRPVHTMKGGDTIAVHIGKNGYHLWARYGIEACH